MKALSFGAFSALCLVASAARAQAPRDTLTPVALPAVVVTVLRTPIESIRAPYSVSANGPEQVRLARPGLGLDEALRGMPGVQVDNRYNYALGERISIRGFGARAQFGVRGVKVIVDGIPATFPDGQTSLSHVDLGLLTGAEVIRGPASALYGNTAGGVIQLETAPAPNVPFAQSLEVIGGSNGLFDLRSTTSGRSGRASYLLGVSRMAYGGYREYESAENLHFNGKFGYSWVNSSLKLIASAVDYDADNPGSLSKELLEADRLQAYANNKRQQTGENGRQGQLGATWRRVSSAGDLEMTGYGIGRSVTNPIPSDIIGLDRAVGGGRVVFRSPVSEPFHWMVGTEGALQHDDRRNHVNEEGASGDLTLDQTENVTNLAVFADATAMPIPRLTIMGGLRYDWFRFHASDHLVTPENPDDSGHREMDAVSPSLGISLEIGRETNLYANVASAFETPTTTELANRPSGAGGLNPELQPQSTLSYEGGAKGALGEWARYQLALYRARVRNALIPFEVPESPGRQFFRNAGSAIHRGVETELTVAPFPGARIRASYTYTDAFFDDYGDFGGNSVPGIAPHRAELVASYSAAGWFAAIENRYSSSTPVNDANTFSSPGYDLVSARLAFDRLRMGRFEAQPSAGIDNIFGEEYNTSVTVNAYGARYFEPGPGRTFHVGLTLRM